MTGCNVHTAEKGITNVLRENDVRRKKIIASLGFIASKQYNCTPYALFYVTGECYYFVCFEKWFEKNESVACSPCFDLRVMGLQVGCQKGLNLVSGLLKWIWF